MKKFLFSLLAVMIATTSFSQKKAVDAITFTQLKHDFGKIKQGVAVTHDFSFKNVASQPVVIESATASCGCTTPTWPKTPVLQSKGDKITAGFNAAAAGPFSKAITVKVAGYDLPVELNITGEVLTAEDYAKYEATKTKKNTK
ncbi:MAG: DUF1573 domain-containing protein [Chitinophagaceae bacterium]|nr:DUF1573 domain-containing protein [Chitinophagaceae bacterium]